MNETLSTWGELCARAEIEPGATPSDAPVQRLLSGVGLISGAGATNAAPRTAPMPASSCCAHGRCGCG
ncbi:MAG: hypothetical protein U1F68_08510 [Gammaproteobacteria bacterium]